jgi:Family of unknown function (DUF6196)
MYVSLETPEQTFARLSRVIAEAELVEHTGTYAFHEFEVRHFPQHEIANALAFVRDENVWSALIPSDDERDERFAVFSFHFTPGLDNSGFVGWLASHLKKAVGTGVFVVCGQNQKRGGIFDYWGAPLSVAQQVIDEVHRLRTIR